MPKGHKRKHDGSPMPTVGKINKEKKNQEILIPRSEVAMTVLKNKEDRNVRKSHRVVKAKRKIDFVYQDSNKMSKVGQNNNAQVLNKSKERTNSKLDRSRWQQISGRTNLPKEKVETSKLEAWLINFDGIQVSVNSDKEDLDYVDDISDQDDKNGNIIGDVSDEVNSPNVRDQETNGNRMGRSEITVDTVMDLGATSNTLTDEQLIMSNLHLKRLLNKMLDERIQEAMKKGESSESEILSRMTPPNTQTQSKYRGIVTVVKSPSDTTIYAPALNLVPTPVVNLVNQNRDLDREKSKRSANSKLAMTCHNRVDGQNNPDIINKISKFVDQIRIDHESAMEGTPESEQAARPKSRVNVPALEEAQKKMERTKVETEKFKAQVEVLRGMDTSEHDFAQNNVSQQNSRNCQVKGDSIYSELEAVSSIENN